MKLSKRRIWGIIIRHLFSWPRDLDSLADAFWWPTFDLLIWGLTTVYLQKQQGVPSLFISFFLGGIVLWMFVYRPQQEMGMTFLKEFWDRNLLNILTTPLTTNEFLLASIILGLAKLIISSVWLYVLAFWFFQFDMFKLGYFLIPFIINLILTGWSVGFVINGIILRKGYQIQAFAWTLILILQPFSAVFYPVSALPVWMQTISRLIPTSYVFEGMRQVLQHGTIIVNNLVIAFLLNGVYLILAMMFFKRSFRKAQEMGMIVKFI